MDASLAGAGAVVLAAGGLTGWIALKAQREHRRWCEGKARVEGVVSRLAARRRQGLGEDASGMSTGNVDTTVPIVRFRAGNGVEYEIEAPEAPMTVGAVVEVAYDPALPSGGRGVERVPKVGIPVALLVVGAILVAVGASRG
jgi:hypothetical protein